MTESTVLSAQDLRRLRSIALEDSGEQNSATQQKQKLQAISQARAAKWGNTLDGGRKTKENSSVLLAREREAELQRIDAEEQDYRKQQHAAVVSRAASLIAAEEDRVKSFKSALIVSDAIAEREKQLAVRALQMSDEQRLRLYHERQVTSAADAMRQREEKEAAERNAVARKTQQEQLEQLRVHREAEQRAKAAEWEEGQHMRARAAALVAEQQATAVRLRAEAARRTQENVECNRQLEALRVLERAREAAADAEIAAFAVEKERSVQMRNERASQRASVKLATRQRLIDAQSARLAALRNDEEERTFAAQVAAEKRAENEAQEKQRKQQEMIAMIKDSVQLQLARKAAERQREESEAAKRETIRKQELHAANLAEERKAAEARRVAKEIQRTRADQINARQQAALTEADTRNREAAETRARERERDAEFTEYTAQMASAYAASGRDVRPMRVLAKKLTATFVK